MKDVYAVQRKDKRPDDCEDNLLKLGVVPLVNKRVGQESSCQPNYKNNKIPHNKYEFNVKLNIFHPGKQPAPLKVHYILLIGISLPFKGNIPVCLVIIPIHSKPDEILHYIPPEEKRHCKK